MRGHRPPLPTSGICTLQRKRIPSPRRLYDNCVRGPFRICLRRESDGDRGPPSVGPKNDQVANGPDWPSAPPRSRSLVSFVPLIHITSCPLTPPRCSSHTRPPLRGSLVTRSQGKGAISRVTCIVKQLVCVFMREYKIRPAAWSLLLLFAILSPAGARLVVRCLSAPYSRHCPLFWRASCH